MAFTNFYLIAGGAGASDINAGSSTGAAQATTTNGNWNSGTGVFIAASGTPFASTVVGDYASVYTDGATVTGFVGKVTTVTSSTQITVDVATIKYGQTIPSTSATGRSCTINGAWNSEIVLAATGLATFTVPQSTKINIKGNLTITANRTVSMAGATTTPLWFAGYTTTPGDLDSDTTNTLTKPIWTVNSTFRLTFSGNYQIWSGLSVTASVNSINGVILASGSPQIYSRVRVENTNNGTNAAAFVCQGANVKLQYSWFKAPTTATSIAVVSAGVRNVGCVAEGGGSAGWDSSTNAHIYAECIGLNNVGAAFLASTGNLVLVRCTAYNATVDGVKWTGTPGAGSTVIGCAFVSGSNTMTNGINNASGTNTANVHRACNDFYNVTNPAVGFGDAPAFFAQTESASPVTSSTDLTPIAGSTMRRNGFPGVFENQPFSSYANIGAVQHADRVANPGLYNGGSL